MIRSVLANPWVQAIGALVALAVLAGCAYLLSFVLVPLLLAFFVAYLFDPVVDFFENRGVRRSLTISGLAVLGVLVLLSVPIIVVPKIISEADQLIQSTTALSVAPDQAPNGLLAAWKERAIDALPLDEFVRAMGWGDPATQDAEAILRERIGTFVKTTLLNVIGNNLAALSQIGKGAGVSMAQLLRSTGQSIANLVLFLANLGLFAVVAGYLLRDFNGLVAGAKELVPPRCRVKVADVVSRIDMQVKGFVRGQLLVCLCLGTMYGTGLLIARTPFAIPIALFGAIASFVPYLGPIVTLTPSLLLSLLRYGVDWHILAVLITFVIAQAVEGSVLTPRVVGDRVGLGEVWVILAVLVFGSTMGFLGMLLALPIAAGLKVLVLEGVEYYKRTPLFDLATQSNAPSCEPSQMHPAALPEEAPPPPAPPTSKPLSHRRARSAPRPPKPR